MRIKALYISIGGFFGGSTEIRKEGRDILYCASSFVIAPPEDEPIRVRPTQQAWEEFFDCIKPFATSWKKKYWMEACDGTQWEVRIVTDTFSLKCFGSNDFPDDFDRFMRAVRKLTGIDE